MQERSISHSLPNKSDTMGKATTPPKANQCTKVRIYKMIESYPKGTIINSRMVYEQFPLRRGSPGIFEVTHIIMGHPNCKEIGKKNGRLEWEII